MLDEILLHMQANWIEWLFAALSFILTGLYRDIKKRLKAEQVKNEAILKEQQAKNAAIAEGVQSLLRESIVQNYNKYQEREFCPIYAKESIKRVYEAYHNLGGNDVATKLYKTLLDMPEEQPDKEEE